MPHCRHFLNLFDLVKSYHVDEGSVHGEKPSYPETTYVLLAIAAILVATEVALDLHDELGIYHVVGGWPERTGVATLLGLMGLFIGLQVSMRVVTRKAKAKKSAPQAR